MSHLGDRLSALVDGELGGAERDRAHAHLAGCGQCRTEAAELRALKQKLRGLMDGAPAETAMTSRLIAMTGPGGPMPPRRRLLRVVPGRRPGSPPPGPVASRPGSPPRSSTAWASSTLLLRSYPPRAAALRSLTVRLKSRASAIASLSTVRNEKMPPNTLRSFPA